MCKCVNISFGSKECFDQQVLVDIPPHMSDYKSKRIAAGLSGQLAIDPCIFDEIHGLWNLGIITHGCCCGHNIEESFVNVDDRDIPKMIELGYVQNHPDKERTDTFRLKSA